jgi:hypothetical protein
LVSGPEAEVVISLIDGDRTDKGKGSDGQPMLYWSLRASRVNSPGTGGGAGRLEVVLLLVQKVWRGA